MTTPAFWLPGLAEVPTEPWARDDGSRVELTRPVLNRDLLARQLDALHAARVEVLDRKPIGDIVRAIDTVARRLLAPNDALRREALDLLPAVTGLSAPMAELVLDRMAGDWLAESLERILVEEFGNPAVLDGFADSGRRLLHATGPGFIFHFFSGNVPGVAVTSLIRGLLVKAVSFGKTALGEPVLPVLFARGLAEADPDLGRCVAVAYWRGGTEELEAMAVDRAGAVIAYGGRDAIDAIRKRLAPGKLFLEYGNRISFGLAAREAMTADAAAELAADAALAVATFDQQGCVSPHLVYVEQGGAVSPPAWARMLADELSRVEAELPRGAIGPEEAAAIQQLRGRAEVASAGGVELHASAASTAWTVIYDPDPRFDASSLNRTIHVKPLSAIEDVPERVAHLAGLLQTVGIAGVESRLRPVTEALAHLGVTRFAPFAQVPWPEPWWRHDGRPPLGDLVVWSEWER